MGESDLRHHDTPFPGPTAFGDAQKDYFFGREIEIRELKSLVVANQTSLVYAESAVGKSSLVAAGLIPELKRNGIDVIGSIMPGRREPKFTGSSNPFIFKVLRSLCSHTEADLALTQKGVLAEGLERERELRHRERNEFRSSRWTVLVLDQLEEVFINFPNLFSERREFFEELGKALERIRRLRILMVLREDYLAQLEQYASSLPAGIRMKYRLERLDRTAAQRAIVNPLQRVGRSLDSSAVSWLIRQLQSIPNDDRSERPSRTTELIEPLQLQIYCGKLYSKWPEGSPMLSAAEVESAVGVVRSVLAEFYDDCIGDVAREGLATEGDLRGWVHRELITRYGTRRSAPEPGKALGGGIGVAALTRLAERKLLRVETRDHVNWYELAHERFVHAVKDSNTRWWSQNALSLDALERRAKLWKERQSPLLRNQFEIAELRSRLLLMDASPTLQEFVSESEKFARELTDAVGASYRARFFTEAGDAVLGVLLAAAALNWALLRDEDLPEAEESLHYALLSCRVAANLTDGVAHYVNAVAFSPDGEFLVAAQANGMLTRWRMSDVRAGNRASAKLEVRAERMTEPRFLNALVWHPCGQWLAVGGKDGFVHLVDPEEWCVRRQLRPHTSDVRVIALSVDGRYLITGSNDGTAVVLDTDTWAEMRRLRFADQDSHFAVRGVCFGPDSSIVALAGENRELQLWNWRSEQRLQTFAEHKLSFNVVAYSGDDQRLLAAANADGTVKMWTFNAEVSAADEPDLQLQKLPELGPHGHCVNSVAFSDNGLLATASATGTVKIWDTQSRTQILEIPGHTKPINSASFSPSGRVVEQLLATGGADQRVITWRIGESYEWFAHKLDESSFANDVVFSPTGERFAVATSTGEVLIWDSDSRQKTHTVAHPQSVNTVVLHLQLLISACADAQVRIWRLDEKHASAIVANYHHGGPVNGITISRDGSTLVSVGADACIICVDLATFVERWRKTLPARGGTDAWQRNLGAGVAVNRVALDASGARVAVVTNEGGVTMMTASTGEKIWFFENPDGDARDVAFLPGDRHVLTAWDDGHLIQFDAASGEKLIDLAVHRAPINGIAVCEHGGEMQVATASFERLVRVLMGGQLKRAISIGGHSGPVNAVAFSPDARLLVTAGADGKVLGYYNDAIELIRLARERAGRDLTDEEWNLYFGAPGLVLARPGTTVNGRKSLETSSGNTT